MPTWSLRVCARCGAEMEQAATGRPRRFCSAACRTADYRARVTKVNRTGYLRSEGGNTQGAGETSSAASGGQPGRTVAL